MKQSIENPISVRQEILALGKFSSADVKLIRRCHTQATQLGFSYQLAFVKIRNYFPKQQPLAIEVDILAYCAYQLHLVAELIHDYKHQRSLIQQHQQKIKAYLHLHDFDDNARQKLVDYLLVESYQTEQLTLLMPRAQCYLNDQSTLQPALSTLRRIIGATRDKARRDIEIRLVQSLPESSKEKLLSLLSLEGSRSLLWQLKQPPGLPSADAIKGLMQRLNHIESLTILRHDISWLNQNYKRQLVRRVRYYSVTRIKSMPTDRQLALLICLCHKLYEETIDFVIEMLIKLFDRAEKMGKKEINQAAHEKRKEIKKTLEQFKKITAVILDEDITDEALRKRIYAAVSKKKLQQQLDSTNQWLDGRYSHVFYLLKDRYGYFRKFFPTFIDTIELKNDGTQSANELLNALAALKQLNQAQDNSCPNDAPIDFIPKRLKKFVIDDEGKIDRHAWETALLQSVRDEIKHGNLSAKHGRFFCQFDAFFMPDKKWQSIRDSFFKKAGLPSNAKDIKPYLTTRLHSAIDLFIETEKTNSYAKVEDDKWTLSVDPAFQLSDQDVDDLTRLKQFLKRNMRQIKLPDLLIEVDNDLHFTHQFMSYDQRQKRDKHAVIVVIAAIMAWGCGIGLSTMVQLVEGVTYDQLKAVTDYFLSDEDNQRYALQIVVNALCELDITGRWGKGHSSASDSIRMEYHSKVLQRGYSTCFGDYAIEFYTYVADNYAPFFSKPIECTNRDSGHTLDGIMYNATSLALLDHYVDTHGYMEINFTGFNFNGKRLNPRIKNVKHQRLYAIEPDYPSSSLSPLLIKDALDFDCIMAQYDRMGQFYASQQLGYATASDAMRRLATFSDKNDFYRANRDFGRIIKTENILLHMADPKLREKRRRGLLKVEQLHQLSREVSYGKHGKITGREMVQLRNSCSCLTLIDACIVYWQSKEMMRVCEECDPVGEGINLHLLKYVSPIEWSNLILYGEYFIRESLIH